MKLGLELRFAKDPELVHQELSGIIMAVIAAHVQHSSLEFFIRAWSRVDQTVSGLSVM